MHKYRISIPNNLPFIIEVDKTFTKQVGVEFRFSFFEDLALSNPTLSLSLLGCQARAQIERLFF